MQRGDLYQQLSNLFQEHVEDVHGYLFGDAIVAAYRLHCLQIPLMSGIVHEIQADLISDMSDNIIPNQDNTSGAGIESGASIGDGTHFQEHETSSSGAVAESSRSDAMAESSRSDAMVETLQSDAMDESDTV